MPDRRRANIEEAERVIRELPQAISSEEYDRSLAYYNLLENKIKTEPRGVYTFISTGLDKMQEVLQKDFIAVWDSIYPYDFMSGSFELTQIVNNSANVSEEKPWRAAVQLRLEEKLIASKRALYNLDRVHDAYSNAALLVNQFTEMKKNNFDSKIYLFRDLITYDGNNFISIFYNWLHYDRTYATDTISSYLENLKIERNVSKLSFAAVFTSDKIMKLVDEYQESVTSSQDNIRQLISLMDDMADGLCRAYRLYTFTLLSQWLTKQNDHYNRSSDYEKAAMERYFMPTINSSIYRRMLRRDRSLRWDCYDTFKESVPSDNFTTLSLQKVIAFKNKMDSFLRKSRLDGNFFRYVSVV